MRPDIPLIPLLILITVGLTACDAADPGPPPTSAQPADPTIHSPASPPAAAGTPEPSPMVKLHLINADGQLVGPLDAPRVEKTDAQWQAQLTAEQYRILRKDGTEPAFCGTLLDNRKQGIYTCAGCGLPLFSSDTKFKSGTGWPSFYAPIAGPNITELQDRSHGMVRTEIQCARCDGHLGHVFNDGPAPTGLRYCLNSASLHFTESTNLQQLSDPATDNPTEN